MKQLKSPINLFIWLLFLLLAFLVFIPEAYALMWDDFAKGMNEAFSKKNVFTINNLIFLTVILLISITVIYIIYLDTIKTDIKRRQAYQKFQKELQTKKQYMKGSNNRSWFRLPIILEFKWHALPVPPYAKQKYHKDIIIDISGGGLLFKTTQALNIKDDIKLWLTIDKNPIELNAQVVRVQEEIQADKTYYLVAVKFINIREGIRDKIIAWITKSQSDDLILPKEDLPMELDKQAHYLEDMKAINNDSLLPQTSASFSGSWQENKIELLVNLQEKSLPLSGTIINTNQENENSIIITLKIDI